VADLLDFLPPATLVPVGHYGAAGAGVTIAMSDGIGIASIVAVRGQAAALADRCVARFGVALPSGPRWAAGTDVTFIGLGPGRWLAVSDAVADLEGLLAEGLGASATVCDQSDGFVLFDVTGPAARDALAKGVAVDLDPVAFGPGDAATTSVAQIGLTLWQVDGAPTFRLAVGRSFAPSISRFLVASAAEFGCAVRR
jgi:heterotetrameric sarcosine oxidase gamma subunit